MAKEFICGPILKRCNENGYHALNIYDILMLQNRKCSFGKWWFFFKNYYSSTKLTLREYAEDAVFEPQSCLWLKG